MAELIIKGTPVWMFIIMLVCILLVVVGFALPPTAVIDGSVLTAVGELMGFGLLVDFVEKLPAIIKLGAKAKIQHGDTTIEVGARKKDDFHEPHFEPHFAPQNNTEEEDEVEVDSEV